MEIDKLKHLRLQIDLVTKLYEQCIYRFSSTALMPKFSLYKSKMWLGIALQNLGDTTPYIEDSKREKVEDIKPQAENVSEENLLKHKLEIGWANMNMTKRLSYLRTRLSQLEIELKNINQQSLVNPLPVQQSFINIVEAKMGIGLLLHELKLNIG